MHHAFMHIHHGYIYSFHSQPQAYCTTKPTKILLRFSLTFVLSLYFYVLCLPPPFPPISQSPSPPPILARIQQTFCGDQHKSKKYFFLSLRAKTGFEIQLQRYLRDQFLPGRYTMF